MSYSDETRRERERTERLLDEMDRIRDLSAAMANLSACLRDAGALCRAWEMGNESCPCDHQDWTPVGGNHVVIAGAWRPGCSREAER